MSDEKIVKVLEHTADGTMTKIVIDGKERFETAEGLRQRLREGYTLRFGDYN
jgi:hypothetical protein